MGDSLSPSAGARGWRPLGKGLGYPVAPHPPACASVCSVLVSRGNWAQAQGELTVQTQVGVGGGRDRKPDPELRTACLSWRCRPGPSCGQCQHRGTGGHEAGRRGRARAPQWPWHRAGKTVAPQRMSDPSQCDQVYSGRTSPFLAVLTTGTSGMHDSRKISPGSTRTVIPLRPPRPGPGPACLGSGQVSPAG